MAVFGSTFGGLIRRDGYVVEQLSSFAPMVREIRRRRPHLIFYSDNSLGFQLFRWRRRIGVPYKLLFSNGGPCYPPFERTDHVHQVAPYYLDSAIAAGEPPQKHTMVPYGIRVPAGDPVRCLDEVESIRRRLNLPVDHKIVLSVGWISAAHKRMDYLVAEIASLPSPRPFLLMLGLMDQRSEEIVRMATEALGPEGFAARSVPYEQVSDYYRAADVFALCSLQEGFGRVYLEALMHGLPCAVHDHPVMRFVLGPEGSFGDLSRRGGLSSLMPRILSQQLDGPSMIVRRRSVRERFSWPVLAPAYRRMFLNCVNGTPASTTRTAPKVEVLVRHGYPAAPVVLAVLCFVMVGQVVAKPRIFEYPFFMAFAFAGFVVPQAYGLLTGGFAPDDWVADTMLVTVLCLGACWIGYAKTTPKAAILQKLNFDIAPGRLAVAGVVFSAIGVYFDYKITSLPASMKPSQWTGIVTIYGFFANQIITGFAISLFCALRYRYHVCWVLAAGAAVIPIRAIVLFGRRETAALFLLTIMMAFYFIKRWYLPRAAVVGLLVFATVAIPATEQYRRAQGQKMSISDSLSNIDLGASLRAFADPAAVSEVKNAMYVIEASRASSSYQFGAAYWNRIVFNFVPAQFVGTQFKNALMIGDAEANDPTRLVAEFMGYNLPTGSTMTGYGR